MDDYRQFQPEYIRESPIDDYGEPPPAYGSSAAPAAGGTPEVNPPPYNPNGLTSSLRFALSTMEEYFLGQEQVPEYNRTGTLRPRANTSTYSPIVEENVIYEDDPPRGRRGRERVQRGAREFANTLTLRGNRRRVRARRGNEEPSRDEVLKTLPTFWPICTVLITSVQILLFIAVCIVYGLAPISFVNVIEQSSSPICGFATTTCNYLTKEIAPNFFIGPPPRALIHVGAQYTPCIRDNVQFRIQAAIRRNDELNLRCCHAECGYDSCGMVELSSCLSEGDCRQVLGGASICRNESVSLSNCGNVTLHPCCIGLLGDCVITTEENCTFQNGYYHPDKAVCSDIGEGCFDDVCSFEWTPWLNGAQGLRFILAIFLHRGIVDLLILMLAQFYIAWRIERRIGWLRLILIYIISGVGGFLLSGLFIPQTVSVGASGALCGLLGVQLVELLQGWKWIKRPLVELIKLLIFDAVLLGTLPYIDNYANIGGFIFGILSAFIFVPYISVGKWDRVKKLCLILIALPLVCAMFLVGFVVFYNLRDPNFCTWCSYINCIPYTETFCDDFIGTIRSIIPTIPTPTN